MWLTCTICPTIPCARSLVFVVDAAERPWSCSNGLARVLDQLFARLVETNDRAEGIVGQMVDVNHVLHRVHERAAVLGWNAETLHRPWLDVVFFSRR